MEKIFLPRGMGKYLGETFKRSHVFVRQALRGESKHPDALKIREFAKKKLAELNGEEKVTVLN